MVRVEREFMDGWRFALTNAGKTEKETLDLNCPGEAAFREVALPHDWAIAAQIKEDAERGADQGYFDRWGIGWYRKDFELSEIREKVCYFLDFGGVFEDSTVWVNGVEAGGCHYGCRPFRLNITEALQTGKNEILVRVNNTASPADRWYSGCGIYRTVKWVEVNERHLFAEDVTVRTEVAEKGAFVHVKAEADGEVRAVLSPLSEEPECRGGFLDREGLGGIREDCQRGEKEFCAEAEGKGGEWLTLAVENPRLWSAEEPFCYKLTLSLMEEGQSVDEISLRIGIRKVEFLSGKGLFVNGKETVLKGVCLHQDMGCRGTAAKKEMWRQRLLDLKEMGCNAIRAAHHMHSEEFLDLCDELGFYVYEECFDKWTGGLYGRYFETDWKKDVRAMIDRDKNRPSVIIWGVGNEVENQGQPSMLAILKELTDYVRALDSSRPVTCAMNPHFKRESNVNVRTVTDIQQFVDEVSDTEITDNGERIERICAIGRLVDIISCNYQEQWYSMIHEAMPEKLILGTEIYQYFCGHSDQMQNYTEENPSLVPFRYPWCIGGMIWTGIDYLGESMGYPSKGWSGSMIRTNGERRANYYTLQSYWRKEPMVHFAVLDASFGDEMVKEHWDAPMYMEHWDFPWLKRGVIPYRIATNCEEAAVYLNGKRLYVKKPADFPNGTITGYLPWQPGEVKAVGYRNGKEAARHVVRTPEKAERLVFTFPAVLPMEVGQETLLTVHAVDAHGIINMRTRAEVSFEVEGAAEIPGVDNGDLTDHTPYQSRRISLYRGAASVVIRMTKQDCEGKGPGITAGGQGEELTKEKYVKVRASAEGLESAEIIVRRI
ncbi:MAG: glycoside hydrolase family 2 protein [Lachnospiraceae bacterium]|jgi:beta-galactosidase|nr:glycoside hydrolase family 2 protein [Lachnospiraceae bacterium]